MGWNPIKTVKRAVGSTIDFARDNAPAIGTAIGSIYGQPALGYQAGSLLANQDNDQGGATDFLKDNFGTILGSTLGTAGDVYGNVASAKEARKNRQWQEYMSNTAYQRQVRDLRAAGLNPALGYLKGSGATTPAGATAQQQGIGKGLQAGTAAARQAKLLNAQLDLIQSQRDAAHHQGQLARHKTITEIGMREPNIQHMEEMANRLGYQNVGNEIDANIYNTAYGEGVKYLNKAIPGVASVMGGVSAFSRMLNRKNATRSRRLGRKQTRSSDNSVKTRNNTEYEYYSGY